MLDTVAPQQIALLGFRAFSRELYCKDAQLDVNTMLKDHMMSRQELQTLERLDYLVMTHLALKNARQNLHSAWSKFGGIVTEGLHDELRYHAIQFEDSPVYFASVGFLPEWDFNGNLLQDLNQLSPFQGIAFSAWASSDRSTAIFCWHKKWDGICVPFIESLRSIPEDRLANRILSMTFEVSENIVLRPSWWESLSQRDKELLARRVSSGLNSNDRTPSCLAEDGLEAIQSRVVATSTNT